jgi:N-acetylglucosamine-6-phosphate deacetylase
MSDAEIIGRDPATGVPVCVTLERGVIAKIQATSVETELYLSSGLIDLQVNGYGGFDVNAADLSIETIVGLADVMIAQGVTCFVPTVITAPEEKIVRALSIIAEARRQHPRVADCVPFVHVEGPHISPVDGYRGAHSASYIRPPSIGEFERWQDASGGMVGMVTVSPHYEDSSEYIRALSRRGVHVAVGHTNASPEQIEKAVDSGARLATHLGNGIAGLIPRHRNPIWAQLADDRLTATFIADGHHLPAEVLQVMLRAKGIGRSILVSDSVALAGMPAGSYPTTVGGKVELHPGGKLTVADTEYLAGSAASLAQCIGNVVRTAGVSLQGALLMGTANPGAFVGGRGRLEAGARGDLVRFRWEDAIIINDIWLVGERVYERRPNE